MKKTIYLLILLTCQSFLFSQNNISISDDESHNADESAVLDIFSVTKGMLVPRMTTEQILLINNPATGLLVFNNLENSFWFYNGANWDDLSSGSSGLWEIDENSGNVYLKDTETNVGIGTNNPLGKLSVVADPGTNPDDPLFEIRDEFGVPVFQVTSEGARLFVKEVSKGVSGGFAVGKYGVAKDVPDTTFLLVTPDSTRVYIQENHKGVSGGFAVGNYGVAKGESNTFFYTNTDSTRVYTSDNEKGVSGGFAVGRYGLAKNTQNYMHITRDNYLIGHNAGESLTNGLYNIFLGYEAGMQTTGGVVNQGGYNLFVGFNSGRTNSTGYENVFMGYQSGINNTTGQQNVFIGTDAGFENKNGFQNVFIGQSSGYNNISGTDNIYIGENACYSNQNGQTNIAIGNNAGYLNSGNQNIFMGQSSGRMNQGGNQNIIIGLNSGYYNDTGSGNLFIGVASGNQNDGSDNVFIGKHSGYYESGSNKLYIENTFASSSDAFIYGEFDNNYLQFNVNTGGVEGKVNINNVLKLTPRDSAPEDPEEGDLYYDGILHVLRVYDGGQWINLW